MGATGLALVRKSWSSILATYPSPPTPHSSLRVHRVAAQPSPYSLSPLLHRLAKREKDEIARLVLRERQRSQEEAKGESVEARIEAVDSRVEKIEGLLSELLVRHTRPP